MRVKAEQEFGNRSLALEFMADLGEGAKRRRESIVVMMSHTREELNSRNEGGKKEKC